LGRKKEKLQCAERHCDRGGHGARRGGDDDQALWRAVAVAAVTAAVAVAVSPAPAAIMVAAPTEAMGAVWARELQVSAQLVTQFIDRRRVAPATVQPYDREETSAY
jgi:hypothetical protein